MGNSRKRKKNQAKTVLLVFMLLILCVAVGALLAVLKLTDKEKGVQKYEIPEEKIEANSSVKEQTENDETGLGRTIAVFFHDNQHRADEGKG